MNKKLRKWLEQNGLRATATEQEAWELYDRLQEDGVELPGIDPGTRSAAGAQPDGGQGSEPGAPAEQGSEPGQRSYSAEEVQRLINDGIANGIAADHARQADVSQMLSVAGIELSGEFGRSLLVNPHMTRERAAAAIFAELQQRNTPIGVGAQVGRDFREKFRDAARDGLLMRSGVRVENPADGYREFRSRSLLDVCREALENSGINTRTMSRMELAGRALTAGSTSDLPYIFSSLVNRNLLAAYGEAPQTWRPLVAVTSAMDFRDLHAVKLSGAPNLQEMKENGEYETATLSDAKESYRLVTYGRIIRFTRQMIVNDDLRALSRLPILFGAAARRKEADAVYSLITTNAALASDSVALFHATHSNLGSAAALSTDALSAGRKAMRLQTGMAGERLDIMAAFLLTPVALETTADVLLRSPAIVTADMSGGVVNPHEGKLTSISEPRLDDNSTTAWYLFASPAQAPVIEVAWLEGEEQPYVEEEIDFNSDSLAIKVRHDFGAGVVDYVGGFKNAGA